jgi:hypothetical protein
MNRWQERLKPFRVCYIHPIASRSLKYQENHPD